uniref:C-type lectin domain-containing protein n=1 Tax=Panagrolaimus davidi TaxID=227884 RepID=A0A914QCQ3_9BILA
MNSKIITIFVSFFLTISAVCPNGSVSWQTDCYFFQANASGFPTAESDCNLMGGHLVSIHDGFVNALLTNNAQNLFHESTVTDFWIGFTNLMTLQNWTWMDESSSHFTEWCPNDPNNTSGLNSFVMAATLAFWTGGFSNDGGKTWAWSDRTLWDYNPWDHRYPHLNASACVAGGGSGAFDQQCNTIYRVMCKKPL